MIGFAAFSEPEMSQGLGSDGATLLGLLFVGLLIWSGVGVLFYRLAYSSFRERSLQQVIVLDPRPIERRFNNRLGPLADEAVTGCSETQEAERPGDIDRHVR